MRRPKKHIVDKDFQLQVEYEGELDQAGEESLALLMFHWWRRDYDQSRAQGGSDPDKKGSDSDSSNPSGT